MSKSKRKMMHKIVNLFGDEAIVLNGTKKKKPNLFTNHEAFVEKFEAKKTTDDCYTPKEVFDEVLSYVGENFDLAGKKIVRPFWPGADFEEVEYCENSVVIDNPPFSIVTKVARFFISQKIPFFIFAPHLTLFGGNTDCTHLVVGANITYENGAIVKTSFLSNMFGNIKVIGDANLYRRLERINDRNKVNLPKYEYPSNVLTVSHIQWMVERGVSIKIEKQEVRHCRGLDSQKNHKKSIFGSGFLLSEKAAAEKAAAEKAAAEKAAAEKAAAEKAAAEKENIIIWELSEREREIIKLLG